MLRRLKVLGTHTSKIPRDGDFSSNLSHFLSKVGILQSKFGDAESPIA